MRLAISYLLILFLFLSCQKELHFDSVPAAIDTIKTAQGYLGGAPNACTPVNISGKYEKGFAFDSSQYVSVTATVTHGGTYSINSNTVNGMYFKDSGSFTTTGTFVVNLKAYGTPADTGSFVFTVHFNSSVCSFTLHVVKAENVDNSDYFPNTPSSWWKYYGFDYNGFYDSSFITCLYSRQTLNGKTYSLYSFYSGKVPKVDTFWIRKQAGDYIEKANKRLLDLSGYYGLYAPGQEVVFLKDNVPIGTSWNTDTLLLSPPEVTFKQRFYQQFTIVQKDATDVINGITYTNIITVELVYNVDKLDGAGFSQSKFITNTFAKNIGLIKHELVRRPTVFLIDHRIM
ncbi:MAG: hypothetical protein M3Y85_00370 [Bacteroidota bacterium]|nr:hypothetical protein [Bacteroidota bacterium]